MPCYIRIMAEKMGLRLSEKDISDLEREIKEFYGEKVHSGEAREYASNALKRLKKKETSQRRSNRICNLKSHPSFLK